MYGSTQQRDIDGVGKAQMFVFDLHPSMQNGLKKKKSRYTGLTFRSRELEEILKRMWRGKNEGNW